MAKKTFVEYQGLEYGALHYKGTVDSMPSSTGSHQPGDCYRVKNENCLVAWLETSLGSNDWDWRPLSIRTSITEKTVGGVTTGTIFIKDMLERTYASEFTKVVKPEAPYIKIGNTQYNSGASIQNAGNTTANFYSTTSGVTFNYSVTGDEATSGSGTSVTINQDDSNQYKNVTITVKAIKLGQESDTSTFTLRVERKLPAPTITVDSSTDDFSLVRQVTVTRNGSGTKTHYSTDNGTTWTDTTASSFTYSYSTGTPQTAGISCTFKASEMADGWANSNTATKTITIGKTMTYFGWFGSGTITAADIVNLANEYRFSNNAAVAGNYTFADPSSSMYLYFCIPSGYTISSILIGAVEQPKVDLGTVGSWRVYRLGSAQAAGNTYKLVV